MTFLLTACSIAGSKDNHLTSENGKLALLTSGRPVFRQHAEHVEGSDTSHVSHMRNALSTECENRNFDRNEKRSRSPAGPRRLRDSDAHKRVAVPQALCVLREHPRLRPKSGKVCRSDTRPGEVRERAVRVEGNDSAPSETPLFRRASRCVRFFSESRVCIPTFTGESKRGRLCRRC